MKRLVLLLLLLFVQFTYVFSQDQAWDLPASRSFKESIVPGLIAGGEALFSNSVFMLSNYLYGFSWALPNAESMRQNSTQAWIWEDTDGFIVNQLGHPFQGSLYFTAGRANGFGFYQNLIFSSLGSASWEYMFESNQSAINDFFSTVAGSFSAGEISYRLFAEAYSAGLPLPLAFFLSPMSALHALFTGWRPPPTGKNIYELQIYMAGGYAHTSYSAFSSREELVSMNNPYGRVGFNLVYGDPFQQDTNVPFRHFEFTLSLGMNPGLYNYIHAITDGYLLSFSPVYKASHAMSTGLSLHMDFTARGQFDVHDSTINQYSNALNWTLKYEYLFSENTAMQIKSHAGFTFLGASNYYSPDTKKTELNNFGYGLNSKLFFNIENRVLGRIDIGLLGYILWSYPDTSALSHGTVYWLFSDITYSRFVSEHISVGISGSFAREWGYFGGFPDTNKKNDAVMFFVAWNL